jgi:hypothetical protein
MGDHDGFQPVCPVHGPVQMPKAAPVRAQPVPEAPWQHEVVFGGTPPVGTGRPRGLRQGDVAGAVRRTQIGPKIQILPPLK